MSSSKSRSKGSSSDSLKIKLASEESIDDLENPEKLDENLDRVTKLLEANVENNKHLENLLPSRFIQRDPSCIRKYSNFSFPKDYKLFYDFVDYYPSKDIIQRMKLNNATKVNQYFDNFAH